MAGMFLGLGYGYVAAALGRRLAAAGWRVLGATRGRQVAGIETLTFDADRTPEAALRAAIVEADAVLCAIPPGEAGCPAMRALEAALARRRGWTAYLSTTGVYGDLDGRWAFEWSPLRPSSDIAARRVAAEAQWRGLPVPAEVFRLPGIYGPGRSALDRLRAGDAQRIVKPGQVFSRAHVEDIAAALAAAIARPSPGALYNVCDDEPAPPQDVITFAAGLLGVEPPPEIPFDQAVLSPMARRFYADSKRVSNARAKSALGWRPQFPSYRHGLTAIFAEE